MLFVIVVFALLWVFQILFFESFYKRMKFNAIEEVSNGIINIYGSENYENEMRMFAIENEVSIIIYDKYNRLRLSIGGYGDFALMSGYNETPIYLKELINSKDGEIKYVVNERRTNKQVLIYGSIIGASDNIDGYLLVSSTLEPVESTVAIIKKQMYIISGILIFFGALLSLWASQMIASPIIKITESAKKLAKGNYDVELGGDEYNEVYQLSQTLSYASKEISRVDKLQRDLIANVSHDLRTPLTMLKAYAEMIRDLSGDNPTKRGEHLNIIIDETDRLALLVTEMMDITRIESGGIALNYSIFGIRSKLEDIIIRYKGISEYMGYNIHFEADEEIDVYCDLAKIEQVLTNLVNNAINYTGEDKNVFVKQINQSDGVRIEVRDTGQGISEEDIKLIFDKYYRSENHKREVVGTGLGLSIVKVILKKHNFAYGVQSTIGKGSVFWFKLKLAEKPDEKLVENKEIRNK